ncbi:hypothetical protein [Tsukamurella tyrosinosolvens]|uniref:hypothetical protein n=1 Tax=Tsukamurella tyrosinosolvens TaxID=57704 RepID=UPI001146E9E1|nr:hypothetical protein [Tsukamurella tyrosinosolvens]
METDMKRGYSERGGVGRAEQLDVNRAREGGLQGVAKIAIRATRYDDLSRLNKEIDTAVSSSNRLELDLSNLHASDNNSRWDPIVANILLQSRVRDSALSVIAPAQSLEQQLARSGIMFAIAGHGSLNTDSSQSPREDAVRLAEEDLRPWRTKWRQRARQAALFEHPEIADGNDPDISFRRTVAFVNPDSDPIGSEARERAIYPWLRNLTGELGGISRADRNELLRRISAISTELLDNVVEHSLAEQSVVTISNIRSSKSNQLQIAVIDGGQGIPSSLRRYGRKKVPLDYVEELVEDGRQLTLFARGDGIASIARQVRESRGSIMIASGSNGDEHSFLYDRSFESNVAEPVKFETPALGVQGTVVVVRLPIKKVL